MNSAFVFNQLLILTQDRNRTLLHYSKTLHFLSEFVNFQGLESLKYEQVEFEEGLLQLTQQIALECLPICWVQ